LFHPDDTERADKAWADALSSGTSYEIEFRLKRVSDGAYRWFLGRALPYRDANGEITNWFGTCTDIHALKTAQEALCSARDELQQESLQKDEFLGMISHELRTPLNAVFGWSRLMQENVLNETERIEAVNSIMRNAETQGRLIEEVLDITRIVNRKLSLDRKVFNPDSVIREAIETVRPSAEAKAIKLQTSIESPDLLIYADPTRLQQVVLNLMTNAVKFTPPGGHVSLHVERKGETAVIEVSDTGQGIKPESLPHIFDRFGQSAGSARRQGGLGLGLTIAHQLVVMHDGKIEAQSEGEGKGSRFRVSLPVVALDSAPEQAQRPAAKKDLFPAECLRGLHAMVIDDNTSVRDLVALTLAKCGASVTVASSVRDALNLMPKFTPDVIVSDIAMPDIDGYEFIRKFRALNQAKDANVSVIALTAHGSAQDHDRALKAGFDRHLSKPIDPADLVRTILKTRSEKISATG
jgi:signal transduction histidine kinase/CheY-like chemotaxis protein